MPRDSRVYLEDILEATRKIIAYTGGLSKETFLEDEKTIDAVVRNLDVIGEAVKNSLRIFARSILPWYGRK